MPESQLQVRKALMGIFFLKRELDFSLTCGHSVRKATAISEPRACDGTFGILAGRDPGVCDCFDNSKNIRIYIFFYSVTSVKSGCIFQPVAGLRAAAREITEWLTVRGLCERLRVAEAGHVTAWPWLRGQGRWD